MIIIAIPKPTTEYDRFLLKHFLGSFCTVVLLSLNPLGFFLNKKFSEIL